MKLETMRFGTLDVADEDILLFKRGILGFPEQKRYVLIPHRPGSPFFWLQSVDMPELAFVAITPSVCLADYEFDIPDNVQEELELTSAEQAETLLIVTIPKDNPKCITANLLGPVVINTEKRLGMQVVLDLNTYPVQYPLNPECQKTQQLAP